jgi:hypothetical protein
VRGAARRTALERADPAPGVGRKLSAPIGVPLPNGNSALVLVSTRGMDCAKQQGDGAPAHLCCAKKSAAAQVCVINHSIRGQPCNDEIFSNDW